MGGAGFLLRTSRKQQGVVPPIRRGAERLDKSIHPAFYLPEKWFQPQRHPIQRWHATKWFYRNLKGRKALRFRRVAAPNSRHAAAFYHRRQSKHRAIPKG